MSLKYLPVAFPDESFMSLALRMVKANGHQTLQTLIHQGKHYFDYRGTMNYFKPDKQWQQRIVDLLNENGYEDLEGRMLNQLTHSSLLVVPLRFTSYSSITIESKSNTAHVV
ncbi:hypothetical protein GC101_34070 [Paenibacillus sp. LMG 31459]|uniref:Uncharacterized protein n=1 Tax=Paenibacillus phytohabitans TaxID=2654978 RepID=A0ABX1YSL4_9BACL|nr:hypothetical protein [Paenibacillus phytohabitans]NOU83883.1 hypothetical protein [Paenibacillus phytohabitans]